MERTSKRRLVAMIGIAAGISLALSLAWPGPDGETKSWESVAEGYLAVETPCCTEAALWDELDSIDDTRRRLRPASAVEAAEWLDVSPYRASERDVAEKPQVSAQSTEVRCVGEPTGPDITTSGNDLQTLEAIHSRPECAYVKCKVWAPETAEERPNERHKVWADQDGFFRGRIEYWK